MAGKLLARYPLFRLLSARQLDDWIASGKEIACATGETIFQENTPGAWVYPVRDGKVRILRESARRELTLGMLRAGDVFGEYALLPPGRNTATCRTAAPTRLLRLPLAPVRTAVQGLKPAWKNLKNWLRLHTLLHFRRERSFLGFMAAESGLKLLDRLQPAAFPAGQTIQANGLAADSWHLIEQGAVRLHAGDESETAGVDLGPGETFGEGSLVGWGQLPVAVALSDVRCEVLARHDFDPSASLPSKVAQSYQPRLAARPEAHVWVPQLGPADCGLAALAMAGLRLGAKVSVEDLRSRVTPGPDGLGLHQLRKLGAENGLPRRPVRVSAGRLREVDLPVVAHLNDGHYVVIHALGEAGVVVGDPETGIVNWSLEFLARCYSGALLLFGLAPAAWSVRFTRPRDPASPSGGCTPWPGPLAGTPAGAARPTAWPAAAGRRPGR
jgi:ATP-binding cassette subfamily B protein